MRILFPKLFFSVLIISQVFSCKKASVIGLFNVEFPNNVGTFWKYRVYDSLTSRIDTITIKVVGDSKLDDGTDVKAWQINSLYNAADTNYVYLGMDGVKIFANKLASAPVIKTYVFPLSAGAFWRGQLVKDTSRVISRETRITNTGTFDNSFQIKRNFSVPFNYSLYEVEYFKPNVGMITRAKILLDGGLYENSYWELVSYYIQN